MISEQENLHKQLNSSTEVAKFMQYEYRFVILLVFSFISFMNGMCWVTVTPISVPISAAYHISPSMVSLIPLSYLLVYPFVNFPSNWVIDVKGIKLSIYLGTILNVIGTGIRCFCGYGFWYVIAGQMLCAIAQPFLGNAVSIIAVRWFLPKSRTFALVILSVSNNVGAAVGFLMPTYFVQSLTNKLLVQKEFEQLLIFQFVLVAIAAVLVFPFFKESPPTPPSQGSITQHMSYSQTLKSLFCNHKFLILLLAYGVINGAYNIYSSLLDQILDCYGFTNGEVSIYGFIMTISGIVFAAILGYYVEKTLNYRKAFVILAGLGVIQTFLLPLCLVYYSHEELRFWIFAFIVFLQGLIFIPFQPITFDYACDVLFPAGQAQITGTILMAGQIIGVIFTEVSQKYFQLGKQTNTIQENQLASLYVCIMTGVISLLGILAYPFFKWEMKRSEVDRKRDLKDYSLVSPNQIE